MSMETYHAQVMEGREFARRWRELRANGVPLPNLFPLPDGETGPAPRPFPYFDHRNCSQWERGE